MKIKLNQASVFHLNRLNNRVRMIHDEQTSINTDEGIFHLIELASKSNDQKVKVFFKRFVAELDSKTIELLKKEFPDIGIHLYGKN